MGDVLLGIPKRTRSIALSASFCRCNGERMPRVSATKREPRPVAATPRRGKARPSRLARSKASLYCGSSTSSSSHSSNSDCVQLYASLCTQSHHSSSTVITLSSPCRLDCRTLQAAASSLRNSSVTNYTTEVHEKNSGEVTHPKVGKRFSKRRTAFVTVTGSDGLSSWNVITNFTSRTPTDERADQKML